MPISGYAQQNIPLNQEAEFDELVYLEDSEIDERERMSFNFIYQALKYSSNFAKVKINKITIDGIHVTYLCTVVENIKGDCSIGDNINIHRIRETPKNPSGEREDKERFIYVSFTKEDSINFKKTSNKWEIISSRSYEHDLGQRALERVKKDFPQLFE